MRTSARHWFLAIGGTLFSAGGLFIVIGKGDRSGTAVFVFFAAGALLGVRSIRRDRQIRAHARALTIEIPEYVPLRSGVSQVVAVIAGMILVGGAKA